MNTRNIIGYFYVCLAVDTIFVFQIIRTNKESTNLRETRKKLTQEINDVTNVIDTRFHKHSSIRRQVKSHEVSVGSCDNELILGQQESTFKTITQYPINPPVQSIDIAECDEELFVCDNTCFYKRKSIAELEIRRRMFVRKQVARRSSV